MVETIFIDESGYTGPDLVNQDQPFFTVASLNVSESQADDIVNRFFSEVQADELKYKRLSKQVSFKSDVINFLEYIEDNQDIVELSMTHKRFALSCKIFDLLVEPIMYEDDVDGYDKGLNLGFSNYLYFHLQNLSDGSQFDDFLELFQKSIREGSPRVFDRFYDKLVEIVGVPPEEFEGPNEPLGMVFAPFSKYGTPYILRYKDKDALDVSTSLVYLLMGIWAEREPNDVEFEIIHDQSSGMARDEHLWESITSDKVPNATVGYDRRTVDFPLRVNETSLEDSEDWKGLQLADILAGALRETAYYLSPEHPTSEDDFTKKVSETVDSLGVAGVFPTGNVTPEEMGTEGEKIRDPNQFIADLLKEDN